VYREWVATQSVTIRRDRRPNAPVVFRINKGEKVTAVSGIVVTTRAGRVQFRKATEIGTSEGVIQMQPKEVLYLLTYLGEGETKAWLRGRLLELADISEFIGSVRCTRVPAPDCPVDPVERARFTWWVEIRNTRGQTGWTNEPEKFDGKDFLG
jgi:hypothetical protein